MYVCSYSPYLFGYETPTEWIQSMQWLKKYIDVDHHLHVDENAKPPLPIRVIEWLGAAITGQADYEISPYFHSPAFLVDFAATFFIYGLLAVNYSPSIKLSIQSLSFPPSNGHITSGQRHKSIVHECSLSG